MQAKQMLATMSNELVSPLSGVVTMAEVLATTDLLAEQRQLVDVMLQLVTLSPAYQQHP
ncbi:hypothetical protein CY35_01G163900 [Sphagnum magellanicum]|jgi:hypothetical protein|nr:hypothetical protein CY35_01G163900 [Sphagnum magellanicum]